MRLMPRIGLFRPQWLGLIGLTLPKALPKVEWAGPGMTKNYDQRH